MISMISDAYLFLFFRDRLFTRYTSFSDHVQDVKPFFLILNATLIYPQVPK